MIEEARPTEHWAKLLEPERAKKIAEWASILNFRHREFFYAQEERARKNRRDQARKLVDELRALVPTIVADADDQCDRFKDDHLSREALRSARRLSDWATYSAEFLDSNTTVLALPPVYLPDNVFGWQWVGKTLLGDLEPLGTNAAGRFITAAIPLMTGEHPSAASVLSQLKR